MKQAVENLCVDDDGGISINEKANLCVNDDRGKPISEKATREQPQELIENQVRAQTNTRKAREQFSGMIKQRTVPSAKP